MTKSLADFFLFLSLLSTLILANLFSKIILAEMLRQDKIRLLLCFIFATLIVTIVITIILAEILVNLWLGVA